jgi:hypothetical protein
MNVVPTKNCIPLLMSLELKQQQPQHHVTGFGLANGTVTLTLVILEEQPYF